MQNSKITQKDMLGRTAILPLQEALGKLRHHLHPLPVTKPESVALEDGLDRYLAQTITARENIPPHPRSTMDGYAIKAADSFGAAEGRPVYLRISGEVLMGTMPDSGPAGLECHKIATGGFLPPGTDAVVMLEHTIEVDQTLLELIKAVAPGENILTEGDDLREGEVVLAAGKKLRPQELGLLAGLGHTNVTVNKKVRVGVFSTGDEVVCFQEAPPPGKIRDMNGVHLAAMARQLGACTKYYGVSADIEGPFSNMMKQALEENDIVLFSGSSSVGSRDLGEQVIGKLADPGVIIHGVAIKPGKPVIVAFAGHKPIFGLPGHPVSAAVAFDLFVRPAIAHLSGQRIQRFPAHRTVKAELQRNINSAAGRTDFVRVHLKNRGRTGLIEAHPVLGKSGALSTMVKADGYVIISENIQGLCEGEMLDVFLFD